MIDRKKQIFNLVILFIFVLIVSFANFFHTEKTPFENDQCPACNLQKSIQATNHINFFYLPSPTFLEILPIIEYSYYSSILIFHTSSRAPPQV
jgi:hypothetical protein